MSKSPLKSNVLKTTAGEVEQVTLEEFIAKIPVMKATSLLHQYNSTVSMGDSEHSTVPPGELPQDDVSLYVRTAILLGENSRQQQLLHILDQVDFVNIEGSPQVGSRLDKIEEAAVHCLENFGIPTHLVEITNNCYGMFCLDDFKYQLLDATMGAIVCYAPRRNIIFRVGL